MPNIKVVANDYTDVTDEADPEEDWSSDSTSSTHDILGLQQVNNLEHFDITIPFDLEPNVPYYLVYGLYSTGDSFHSETGVIEYIDVFKSLEAAKLCQELLEEHYRTIDKVSFEKASSCELIHDDGTIYKFYVPWNGYFENLESIDIQGVFVK